MSYYVQMHGGLMDDARGMTDNSRQETGPLLMHVAKTLAKDGFDGQAVEKQIGRLRDNDSGEVRIDVWTVVVQKRTRSVMDASHSCYTTVAYFWITEPGSIEMEYCGCAQPGDLDGPSPKRHGKLLSEVYKKVKADMATRKL